MNDINDTCYLFIIDTDAYSGNFEREMIAYVVGAYGECEVAQDIAERTQHECPDLPEPMSFPDDHGCCRPATIYPTPGWFNDGLGNQWRDDADPAEVQAAWDKALQKQADDTRKVYSHMPEYGAEQALRWTDRIGTPAGRCPAYQSVAVGFEEQPTPEQLTTMVVRARAFCADPAGCGCRFVAESIGLLGIRLVHHVVTVRDEAIEAWL